MQRYQVVVNGNTYSVTVKNIMGNTAVVDVDGWEFHVAIDEHGDGIAEGAQLVSAPSSPQRTTLPKVAPAKAKKRSSALESIGQDTGTAPEFSGPGVVTAHLPGQILEIAVKVGDKVTKDQMVMKMEAMKMANEVLATIDGTVKEILVEEKQNVLENQALMIIE